MEKLISRIKEDVNSKILNILGEAKQAEQEILNEAKQKAASESKKILERAKKKAGQEKQRIIAEARLKAKTDKAALIDRLLEQCIASVLKDLDKIRKYKNYASVLNKLTERAIAEMPAQSICVFVSKEDKSKLKIKAPKGKKVTVRVCNIGPGTLVEAADKSVRISNEFAEIIEENKQAIKRELMRKLYEK
jgi:vacuolar-type H+-ATPase subunit E/Vma4